ncbi:MAG: 50S ribosomal protein L22 [Candidatus Paceibacterota bacterium]
MQAHAHIKYIRISPKKLRMLRDEIVCRSPIEALALLSVMPQRSAHVFYKAIKSALDNAKLNHNLDENKLKFLELKIDEGPALKRYRAGSRGVAKPYKRRSSHIFVLLEQKAGSKEKQVKKLKKDSTSKVADKK